MGFLTMVAKNLLRRRTRSLLTMAGIAIGIGAVVALTSISSGFESSWERIYEVRGTDMIVAKIMTQSPMSSPFDQSVAGEVLSLPHVARVSAILSDLMGIEDAPTMVVIGLESGTYSWDNLRLVKGRWPANDQERVVMLGAVAAEILKKDVGSPIQIEADALVVAGIYESNALADNGSVILTLPQMQRVTDRMGKVNYLDLRLTPGTTAEQVEELRRTITSRWPGFKAFTAGQVAQQNPGIRVAKGMSWATSIIALIVGAIGVMNTVLMSVFERLREFGILLAIGWRRGRIVRMILCESILLSAVGGLAGILVGIVTVQLLQRTPMLYGKIAGEFSPALFALALGIAVGLGALGGLYPAYRGSRMNPSDALRYE